jgi:fibrillarin-like pre-rRNA processing protein
LIQKPTTEISPGIFKIKKNNEELLATLNLTPGHRVYNEQIFDIDGKEYRTWNPTRSKLAAAIIRGLKLIPITPGIKLLYLGVASGTTCSHISDIVGEKGHIWGVDFSARPIRDLIDNVSRYRTNITPIFNDARQPQNYSIQVPSVDIIYADVAQPDQAEIAIKNAKLFLKKDGFTMLVIKSRSIDVSKKPNEIYASQIEILKKSRFDISEIIELDPYEKDHAFVLAKKL